MDTRFAMDVEVCDRCSNTTNRGEFIPEKSQINLASTFPFGSYSYSADPIVQRLGHRPFTAVTRVRIPLGSPLLKVGRSPLKAHK